MKRISNIIIILIVSLPVFANDVSTSNYSGTHDSNKLVGFEISSPHAYDMVINTNLTFSVWKYGDITAGYIYQKIEDKNDGTETEHGFELGYRQYFWEGLFLSLDVIPTKYNFDYSSNNTSYTGKQIILQSSLGYRFDINILDQNFYFLPIVHIRKDIYKENEWPEYKNEGLFYLTFMFGYRFYSF